MEYITSINDIDHFIDSAHSVVSGIWDQIGVTVTDTEVRGVFKQMGMKYKKVVHIPLKANSEKNLVLRQQWALKFFSILGHQKVVLAIDETWVRGKRFFSITRRIFLYSLAWVILEDVSGK